MSYRIGIDVGGTNTDAALLDDRLQVVASIKSPTQELSGNGVAAAVDRLLAEADVPRDQIGYAMLGTTHCTNAIVQRRDLGTVGVIRIGAPATTAVPPFEGWPADLRAAVEGPSFIVTGGNEFDGKLIEDLDEAQVLEACEAFRGTVDAVAVVGVFSPVSDDQEVRAAELVSRTLDVPVSLSSQIGSIGLLERENATILNAALMRTLQDMARGFAASLEHNGVDAKIYFGQNDGTLMSLEFALRYPVLTIGCGPTNSIRGAAHLSGVQDALVVDIGGTTTDVGVLVAGFPRQSSHAAEIGGITTNFRMPDVLSVGLGGGTIVRGGATDVTVGPDSVGYRITQEALVFGGSTLTASDIAATQARFQPEGRDTPDVDPELSAAADARIREILEETIDRMKPSAADVPIVLVGGGSVVSPTTLSGVSEVIRPPHRGAANAVGAALGDIAGQAEQVFSLRETTRAEALAQVRNDATTKAIAAGAAPETVEILTVEELPAAYIEDTIVVRARAAGRLA
jgi:N-methylhydantoinase A/oxoprolinase/acetone carboxylase beta subunit